MALIIKRKAAPVADPLVEDAVKARPVLSENEKSLAAWKKFPGPNDKPIACAFCGHPYYQPCKGDEHQGCMNFHAAQRRKQGAKA